MTTCPHCGQPVPDPNPPLHLRTQGRAIYDRLRKAGEAGLNSRQLVDVLWGDRPDGGPLAAERTLHVIIWQTNKTLERIGWRIVNTGYRQGYRLVELSSTAHWHRRKLTPEERAAVRESKKSRWELAFQYGVSEATISNIRRTP